MLNTINQESRVAMADVVNDNHMTRVIELALMEDSGLGDLTSEAIVDDNAVGEADIVCKSRGIIAGLDAAALVFRLCDPSSKFVQLKTDGAAVHPLDVAARVSGRLKGILRGERVALNLLQRMSGIATLTRAYVEAVAGTRAKITDTRKTAPGLRVFDKWAVRVGGGVNHRFGLDDMILIKDNHIAAAGGITNAVEACRRYIEARHVDVAIEVETKNLAEVEETLRCSGVRRIMLDNVPVADMKRAVELINRRVEVEGSGGISLENVGAYAETGVDFISVGALTHSVRALDFSLELSWTTS